MTGAAENEVEHAFEVFGRIEPDAHLAARLAVGLHGDIRLEEPAQAIGNPRGFG